MLERNGEVLAQRSGGVSATTSNKMELTAAIEGIRDAPGTQLRVISDSTYVVKGATLWLATWKEKGWRNGGRLIKNRDLWQILDRVVLSYPAPLGWEWVKGHAGGRFNELADKLAGEAARGL